MPQSESVQILEIRVCLAKEFPLIIFDAYAMFVKGKDENSVKDVSEAMGIIKAMVQHCTVILIHHTGKAETSKVYRGSSHFLDSAHVLLHFDRKKEDLLHVTCRKSKVAPISREQFLEVRYDKSKTEFSSKGWKSDTDVQ